MNVAGLQYTATTDSIWSMTLAFIIVQFANYFANSPSVAVIADKVPADQRGTASGWLGLMTVLDTMSGLLQSG